MDTPSDTDGRMGDFAKYLDGLAQNGTHPDIIITTIRENNNIGYLMSRMLALLDAFANSTPNLENYYKQNIKSITSFAPKNLTRHAFVLHLEEQNVNGVHNKNIALKPYMDDSADKIKYMIDFALARL